MSMNRLRLTRTGPEAGDCTAPYDVAWDTDGRRSVSDFVAAVLRDKSDEWGYIYLIENDRGWMHAPYVEYKYGNVVKVSDSFCGWDDNREIVYITASGGWSRMDYYVRFKVSEEVTKESAEEERRDEGEVYGGAEGKQMSDSVLKAVRAVMKLMALKESEEEADAEGRNEGMQNGEIVNALIENVSLSMADHGVLCYYLTLETNSGGCNFGGRVIGKGELGAEEFEGCAKGTEALMRIMDVVGVEKWEDLNGKYVRVELPGWGGVVDRIGNIIEDRWFSQEEFFGGESAILCNGTN